MQNQVNQFLNPSSMLTPGIAGSVIMMLTNAITFQFDLSQKWVGLALSFTLGLVLLVNVAMPIWQRFIYYVFNSLIVFSMAVGANTMAGPPASASPRPGAPVEQADSATTSDKAAIQLVAKAESR